MFVVNFKKSTFQKTFLSIATLIFVAGCGGKSNKEGTNTNTTTAAASPTRPIPFPPKGERSKLDQTTQLEIMLERLTLINQEYGTDHVAFDAIFGAGSNDALAEFLNPTERSAREKFLMAFAKNTSKGIEDSKQLVEKDMMGNISELEAQEKDPVQQKAIRVLREIIKNHTTALLLDNSIEESMMRFQKTAVVPFMQSLKLLDVPVLTVAHVEQFCTSLQTFEDLMKKTFAPFYSVKSDVGQIRVGQSSLSAVQQLINTSRQNSCRTNASQSVAQKMDSGLMSAMKVVRQSLEFINGVGNYIKLTQNKSYVAQEVYALYASVQTSKHMAKALGLIGQQANFDPQKQITCSGVLITNDQNSAVSASPRIPFKDARPQQFATDGSESLYSLAIPANLNSKLEERMPKIQFTFSKGASGVMVSLVNNGLVSSGIAIGEAVSGHSMETEVSEDVRWISTILVPGLSNQITIKARMANQDEIEVQCRIVP